MTEVFQDLPHWIVEIKEVSAGYYTLVATCPLGPKFEASGGLPYEMLKNARVWALEVEAMLASKRAHQTSQAEESAVI